MEKKKARKIRIRFIPILIVLGLSICLFFGGKTILALPIQNIIVLGNNYLTDQEIIELAEIEEYPSFILSFFGKLEKKIKENPWVKKVKIHRKLWGIIEIQVEEAMPLFEKSEEKKIVLSNRKEISSAELKVPVSGLLNYIPSNKYENFITQMEKINSNIRYLISEITYLPNEQDKDRFLLYMSDGNYVYLTLTKFSNINYYEQVLEQLDGKRGILYLDSGNHFQIMEDISVG